MIFAETYETEQTPEGVYVPIVDSEVRRLADGRLVRVCYVQHDRYESMQVDLQDGSRQWEERLDIVSPPIIGRKQEEE
jgi:hypothetical protein